MDKVQLDYARGQVLANMVNLCTLRLRNYTVDPMGTPISVLIMNSAIELGKIENAAATISPAPAATPPPPPVVKKVFTLVKGGKTEGESKDGI